MGRCGGAKPLKPGETARAIIQHDTLPLWGQLRTLKNDLRGRQSDNSDLLVGNVSKRAPVIDKRPPPLDKRRFSAAVDVCLRTCETSRDKFVLHCAERQVLQIED